MIIMENERNCQEFRKIHEILTKIFAVIPSIKPNKSGENDIVKMLDKLYHAIAIPKQKYPNP